MNKIIAVLERIVLHLHCRKRDFFLQAAPFLFVINPNASPETIFIRIP